MLPTRLVLDDFFGFRHQTIDLTHIGVGVITGRNGAGKSSIFDAIRWALYGRYREASADALIRRRAARVQVSLDFTARGSDWRVVREKPRGKTGTLHLYLAGANEWDDMTGHDQDETQAQIVRLVGLSYAAFMAGPVMVQEADRGDLMALDPRLRKDLLIEEAEVDGYEPLRKKAEAKVAEFEQDTRDLTRWIGEQEAVKSTENADRLALDRAVGTLASWKIKRDAARERQNAAESALRKAEELAGSDAPLVERERSLRNAIAQAGEDLTRHSTAMQRHRAIRDAAAPVPPEVTLHTEALAASRAQLAQITEARVEHATLHGRKAAMRTDLERLPANGVFDTSSVPCHAEGPYAACPLLADLVWSPEKKVTFRAEWDQIGARLTELDLVVLAGATDVQKDFERMDREDRQTRERLAAYQAAREGAETAREAARVAVDEADASIARVEADLGRMRADLEGILAERETVAAARGLVDVARHESNAAAQELSNIESAISNAYEPAVMEARLRVAQIDEAVAKLPALRADLATAAVEHDTYKVLAAAFHRDGAPSMVIRLLLPKIEARANEVLAKMPEEMSLRLLMGQVTKAGALSDRLDIVVTHEGEETPFKMLSGAQQFRVNLALRLGQQRVLAARSGASIEFLLLDEADRDLDPEGIEALVETISVIRADFGLILLISHHDWLIERVESNIKIDRRHGETIAVQT